MRAAEIACCHRKIKITKNRKMFHPLVSNLWWLYGGGWLQ